MLDTRMVTGGKFHIEDPQILANRCFQNMAMFTYLGVTLTSQNCMHVKIKHITIHFRTYNSNFQQQRKLKTSLNPLNLKIHVAMVKYH
jgi:hypothetical protein